MRATAEATLTLDVYEAHPGQPPRQSLPRQGEPGPVAEDGDEHGPAISL
ncbi:hypothetical protein [Methylorubrum salsuginis]|uniref:Uncharacterized protein n=1 Tax=Methylorubrum salsuginis TaxID=414703 RepID=A0A1I3Z4M6_9HYPH|nr:hypothetical protein [Methylorubrum salsuginis]SFK38466.1 hypothetical protein SAMN04488125_101480 [Methylorubrum salsuginis]